MTGSVIPPIYATSTYKQDGVGGLRGGYEYSRSANPTRTALEGNIAALEEGERGFAFASGLAAEDTLIRALCRPGDHVVIPDDAYGGTHRLFDKVERNWGLDHSSAPVSDVDAVRAAIRAGQHEGWSGSRRPPTRCSTSATSRRSPPSPTTPARCWSSTTPSPRRTSRQPLTLGADVVVHSHDEVRRRPLRRRRRRPRRARPRARRAGRLPPERHGRGRRTVRRVAHAAWPEDPRRPDGPALRQRREGRRVPHRPPGRRRGHLPRPARAPRARGREPADEEVRRHRVVPHHRRGAARARRLREGRGLHARRSRSAASSR